jgi:catechol 2,3-dioxygenase-like lactoylglutathione lyase family enzyme
MIKSLSHTTVWVLDQERARRFYVETLGFEVRTDQTMGGFRWLTVAPKGQRELEIVLMPVTTSPMMDEATAATFRGLVEKGVMGGGVLETDDCRATHQALVKKGVTFLREPTEQPYGVEAVFRDDSGNWFSLTERR